MKNIFDMNVGEENPLLDGRVFCTQQLSKELMEESKKLQLELSDLQQKARGPIVVMIVQFICILTAVASLGTVLEYEGNVLTYLAQNPHIGILFGISASIAIGIFIWERKKTKQFQEHITTNDINAKADDINQKMKEELNIPPETKEVDVLRNVYEMKKGKRKNLWQEKGHFENVPTLSYQKEDSICFVIDGAEITIPIQKIHEIEKVKKKTSIVNWTKRIAYNKEPYRKYKITKTDLGAYWIQEYYQISVDSIWGMYQFLLPSYEEEFVKYIEAWKAML